MTLRDHCTPAQLWAHSVLDRVRAGVAIDDETVAYALTALGEPL